MPTNINEIAGADWQIKRGAFGEVAEGIADVSQCIDLILETEKNSDPMRPSFGVGALAFLDKPQHIAVPNIKREIYEQIESWETRATVTKVTGSPSLGALKFVVEWETAAGERGTNEVSYPYGT